VHAGFAELLFELTEMFREIRVYVASGRQLACRPLGKVAERSGVPGDNLPIPAALLPKIDQIKVAAEVSSIGRPFLTPDQADSREIVGEFARDDVMLLAMFARDPAQSVVHPNTTRQALLGKVRHTQREVRTHNTVQSPGILVQDGLTELLFGLAELFGELRVDVCRRRQRTLRAAGLSLKSERRESGDEHANGSCVWHITLREGDILDQASRRCTSSKGFRTRIAPLYEVLLYAEGEDATIYAEVAHLAAMMVDETVTQLDSTRIKPLIDALKMESGGHGGEGFSVREPPPPPYLLS